MRLISWKRRINRCQANWIYTGWEVTITPRMRGLKAKNRWATGNNLFGKLSGPTVRSWRVRNMIARRIIFLRLRFSNRKIKFKGIAELVSDLILITILLLLQTIPERNQQSNYRIKQVLILRVAVGTARIRSEWVGISIKVRTIQGKIRGSLWSLLRVSPKTRRSLSTILIRIFSEAQLWRLRENLSCTFRIQRVLFPTKGMSSNSNLPIWSNSPFLKGPFSRKSRDQVSRYRNWRKSITKNWIKRLLKKSWKRIGWKMCLRRKIVSWTTWQEYTRS